MHASHPKPVQTDLFGAPDIGRPLDTPPWRSLPQRTRRQASLLMARLFLAHRRAEADRAMEDDDV